MPYVKEENYNYKYRIFIMDFLDDWNEFRTIIEERFHLNNKDWEEEPWRVEVREDNKLLDIYCDSDEICGFIEIGFQEFRRYSKNYTAVFVDKDNDEYYEERRYLTARYLESLNNSEFKNISLAGVSSLETDIYSLILDERIEKQRKARERQKTQETSGKQREREQLTRQIEENERKQIIRNKEHRAEIEREFRNDIKYEFMDFCLGACWKKTNHRYGSLFIDSWEGGGRYGAEKYCQECGHKDYQIKWSKTFKTE